MTIGHGQPAVDQPRPVGEHALERHHRQRTGDEGEQRPAHRWRLRRGRRVAVAVRRRGGRGPGGDPTDRTAAAAGWRSSRAPIRRDGGRHGRHRPGSATARGEQQLPRPCRRHAVPDHLHTPSRRPEHDRRRVGGRRRGVRDRLGARAPGVDVEQQRQRGGDPAARMGVGEQPQVGGSRAGRAPRPEPSRARRLRISSRHRDEVGAAVLAHQGQVSGQLVGVAEVQPGLLGRARRPARPCGRPAAPARRCSPPR